MAASNDPRDPFTRPDTDDQANPYARPDAVVRREAGVPADSAGVNDPLPSAPPSSGGGKCLLWGCLATIVLMLLLVVGGGFGAYWLITKQVEKYTDDSPAKIKIMPATDEEIAEIRERIEDFKTTVARDDDEDEAATDPNIDALEPAGVADDADVDPPVTPPTELILTAADLNKLISAEKDLRGRVFIRIADGRVGGNISLPTDMMPGGKGRFINADADFDVSMENGVLVVRLVAAQVKGESLPEDLITAFGSENLAKDFYKDPENAKLLRKFESIEVKDDALILRLRPSSKSTLDSESKSTLDSASKSTLDSEPKSDPGE